VENAVVFGHQALFDQLSWCNRTELDRRSTPFLLAGYESVSNVLSFLEPHALWRVVTPPLWQSATTFPFYPAVIDHPRPAVVRHYYETLCGFLLVSLRSGAEERTPRSVNRAS
jgi:hypothetical protein